MSTEKPVHVPRKSYPEIAYPPVVAPAIDGIGENETRIIDYWRIVAVHRWAILAIVLTVVTVTLVYNLKATPIYRATSTLQIDKENPNILSFKDVYELESSSDDTLRTQFEVLKSRSIARSVIEDLRLEQYKEFQDPSPNDSTWGWLKQYVRLTSEHEGKDHLQSIIDRYLDSLQVAPVLRARLVTISFDSKDPELATRIIDAHAKHFVEQNLQYKWEATQQASEFLSQNLITLKATLEKSEDQLQQYSRDHQILFTDEGRNTASEKLRQLEEEYTKSQADRIQKESYSHLLDAGNIDALPQLVNNQLIEDLTAKLADLQRQESEVAVTFRADYPMRRRLSEQIAQIRTSIAAEKNRISGTIRSEYTAAIERERLLELELKKQRDLVNNVNQEIIQYNILKREAESNKQLHDGLLTRLKEAGVSAGLKASNIRVVDRAEVPRWPVRPRKAINLVISLLGGLLLGIGFAFLQEYLDSSLKVPDDITRHLGLPLLGLIPKLQSLEGKTGYGYRALPVHSDVVSVVTSTPVVDRIVHEFPTSLMAEAYRSIRTSLLLSSPGRPPKTIVVTSATPSEGKTVTASNVAISLTQTGARVLLIDADMRRPRIHQVFSLENTVGLSSFLAGTASLRSIIQETQVPGLLVIPCGVMPPNPGELVLSPGFRRMIDAVQEYFDYIVLDSPPVGNVSDARILAASADTTILVVKAFVTSRYHARTAMNHLMEAHARLGGVVLNDVDVRLRSYYSGNAYYRAYYSGYSGKRSPTPAA